MRIHFSLCRLSLLLLVPMFCASTIGCLESSSPEARQQASLDFLAQLRAEVDLNGKENPDIELGEIAPTIVGKDIDGKEISIDGTKGQVILLSFFGVS